VALRSDVRGSQAYDIYAIICGVQAVTVGNALLGLRQAECVKRFVQTVESQAQAVAEEDKSHFWSPVPGETVEAAEVKWGPMKKIPLYKFLQLLSAEAHRLEQWTLESLPGLFKEYDATFDGHLTR
jgi:hypothetical protein